METIGFIVGIIGNVISILVFTSPIGIFKRVVKNKSTENFKGLSYVTTLLTTSLWTFYGLLKTRGFLLVTVNGIGSVFQVIYVTLFIIYAPKDTKVKMAKLVATLNVGFLSSVILIVLLAVHGSIRLHIVGVLCAALTVGMYASPLESMRTVVKTKSVEYMSFSLSFFLFLNGGVWTIYSVLDKDCYIGIPNVIGFILGGAQIILYAMYKSKTRLPAKSKERDEEAGSLQLAHKGNMQQQRPLYKGNSLPKPSLDHEHSFHKIAKTLSSTPYELHYNLHQDNQMKDNAGNSSHTS